MKGRVRSLRLQGEVWAKVEAMAKVEGKSVNKVCGEIIDRAYQAFLHSGVSFNGEAKDREHRSN